MQCRSWQWHILKALLVVKCQSPVGKTYTANVFGPVITQCRHTGEVYLGRSLHTIKAKLVKLSSPVESSKWGTWAGHDTVCLKCQTGDHLQWKVASALGQVMTQYALKTKLLGQVMTQYALKTKLLGQVITQYTLKTKLVGQVMTQYALKAKLLGQVMTQYVLKAKLVKASPAASSECPWVGHDTVCLKCQTGEVIIISRGK